MHEILEKTTQIVAGFLGNVLPQIDENWWENLVWVNLHVQLQERMKRKGVESIEKLDLAVLLRVFDNNWYSIKEYKAWDNEKRNYLKEMISVRNRWAHVNSDGLDPEDCYRDCDTVQRFLQTINPETALIDDLRIMKQKLLQEYSNNSQHDAEPNQFSEKKLSFTVGMKVWLKSDHSRIGAVIHIVPSDAEDRITIMGVHGEESFYESQLEPMIQQPTLTRISASRFRAAMSAMLINQPTLSTLYSLNAARIDFIPYQFRPVLKFIKSDRPRMLIADSVGVGKTIEAGLILRELQARRDIQSVLIICPKPLIVEKKWQNEMRRFDEKFTHMDGTELRATIEDYSRDGVWPERHSKTIIPYSVFDDDLLDGSLKRNRRTQGLTKLDPAPSFDLVIVDEAHHIRNEKTANYRAVKFFCDNAEAVLFLTATPIQIGNKDLFVLLNTLRPDLIIDEENFHHMLAPNPYINAASRAARSNTPEWQRITASALRDAAATPWGSSMLVNNPIFVQLLDTLDNGSVSPQNRIRMITDIENLHTFNSILNRTRRRDIETITTRTPYTCKVEFTPEQEFIHNELLEIQRQILKRVHGSQALNFMLSTIRRQAASCIFGLVPLIKDILNRHLQELDWDEMGYEGDPSQDIMQIEAQIDAITSLCSQLSGIDPKLDKLRQIISDKQMLANNKLMIFSSFRHTLAYLYRKLSGEGIRIGLIHGGIPDSDRLDLRQRFELPRSDDNSLDVMLFSEVGCEGLDYQFCDTMVNYDLPWNPMRIEQRIGRIDRRGQQSPKVFIYNMITSGTIDADIYTRCLERIGIFENSIGDSEAILGELTSEITKIGDNLDLSDEERKRYLQQIADNQIRILQEEEKLEKEQYQLFGIDIPKQQTQDDIINASSHWISPAMLQHMVNEYLICRLNKDQEYFLGDKDTKILRLSQEARQLLLDDLRALNITRSELMTKWETYLKGGEPHIPITFNPAIAMAHPEVMFFNPVHPFVKQAAAQLVPPQKAFAAIRASHPTVPAGEYDFVIYKWRLHGLRNDLKLQSVCSSHQLEQEINKILENASDMLPVSDGLPELQRWDHLEKQSHYLWKTAREKHLALIKEITGFLRESLETSHKARILSLKDKIAKVTEEKVLRMHNASLTKSETDFQRRVTELDEATQKADITTNIVLYGILKVEE
jgi:ERCC4-related helicase